ncbi:MAG: hypothetical protein ACI8QG_002349, partial [Flavobacteriales bacterium]
VDVEQRLIISRMLQRKSSRQINKTNLTPNNTGTCRHFDRL